MHWISGIRRRTILPASAPSMSINDWLRALEQMPLVELELTDTLSSPGRILSRYLENFFNNPIITNLFLSLSDHGFAILKDRHSRYDLSEKGFCLNIDGVLTPGPASKCCIFLLSFQQYRHRRIP